MAIMGHCGKECSQCSGCALDERIPCSPDCENLTKGGLIKIKECFKASCEEVKYIFNMPESTDEEILAKHGEIAAYPYEI